MMGENNFRIFISSNPSGDLTRSEKKLSHMFHCGYQSLPPPFTPPTENAQIKDTHKKQQRQQEQKPIQVQEKEPCQRGQLRVQDSAGLQARDPGRQGKKQEQQQEKVCLQAKKEFF